MNKSDLIEKLAEVTNMPRTRVDGVVDLIFDAMSHALAQGDRVEIRGFGSFVSRTYEARAGRNPRTGESIAVHKKRLPFFKVGKELRERVQQGTGGDVADSDADTDTDDE